MRREDECPVGRVISRDVTRVGFPLGWGQQIPRRSAPWNDNNDGGLMSGSVKVAIVAALEREVRPLVKGWLGVTREYLGRGFKFFENGQAVVVCGGIGADAARRATEAAIALYEPEVVLSVGFAGALEPALKVGEIFSPIRVIDARDGSSVETVTGRGVLVSVAAIADVEQKAKLAESYGAQAVDMEASAVARGAQARGVRFMAVKAISDESTFVMPSLDSFVDRDGRFRGTAFAARAAVQPWLWSKVFCLARNSMRASRALCAELGRYIQDPKQSELHPISKAVIKMR
jgi:adenosylhomocysteine nucleosidase